MRSLELLQSSSVCQDSSALRDPDVKCLSDVKRHEHSDCPLIDRCSSGTLLGPRLRNCIPRMAQDVARIAAKPGGSIEVEMADFRQARVFSLLGFIDPYATPDPDDLVTNKDEICAKVEGWVRVLLDGQLGSVDEQINGAHCHDHGAYSGGCERCRLARTAVLDTTEVVRPNGIPKLVPHNKCRCPILMVGDFCPVHGG